jgi:hypothetical protein
MKRDEDGWRRILTCPCFGKSRYVGLFLTVVEPPPVDQGQRKDCAPEDPIEWRDADPGELITNFAALIVDNVR